MKKIILFFAFFITSSIDLFSMCCLTRLISSCRSTKTPVHKAVELNDPDTIKILADAHLADLNMRNASGQTPLHLAALLDRVHCVRALVKTKRVDLDAKDPYARTALDIAVSNNSLVAIRILVHAGADRSHISQAVIQKAIDSGNYEIALLLAHGKCSDRDLQKLQKAQEAMVEKDTHEKALLKRRKEKEESRKRALEDQEREQKRKKIAAERNLVYNAALNRWENPGSGGGGFGRHYWAGDGY